jgi:hypothetical protein
MMEGAKWWILAFAISSATVFFISSAAKLIVVLGLIDGCR